MPEAHEKFSFENAYNVLWNWLTRGGVSEPDVDPPDVNVSGVVESNLDAADDEVSIFGAEGGGAGTRRIANVDSSGRIRTNVEDGQDATQGATTDAAVTAGAAGTVSAKLRSISRDVDRSADVLEDAWDDASNALRVTQDAHDELNANANLQVGNSDAPGGAGATTASTPRTVSASDSPDVVSLGVMDDWDESDRAKVNPVVGVAGVAAGAGASGTNTQRTITATDSPDVTALQIMDDWDESDRAKVNPIAGQAGVQAGAGLTTANTQRVTVATDDVVSTGIGIMDDWDEADRAKVNPVVGQAGVAAGAGAVGANTQRATLASDDPAVVALQIIDDWDETDRAKVNPIVGQAGVQAGTGASTATTQRVNLATDGNTVQGTVAHDGVDAGSPVKVGYKAVAHGSNPTAVAANDRTDGYANRHGIPFTLGGHPNIITAESRFTAVQNDTAIVTVGAGTKIVVTQIMVTVDEAVTVGVNVRIGFGTATLPAQGTGVNGILFRHEGMVPGGGAVRGDGSGILGIGADNEDLRVTCETPTSGALSVVVSYFTIES